MTLMIAMVVAIAMMIGIKVAMTVMIAMVVTTNDYGDDDYFSYHRRIQGVQREHVHPVGQR